MTYFGPFNKENGDRVPSITDLTIALRPKWASPLQQKSRFRITILNGTGGRIE
jgi:hypothetical protein